MPEGQQRGTVGYEHILELLETETVSFHCKRNYKDGT